MHNQMTVAEREELAHLLKSVKLVLEADDIFVMGVRGEVVFSGTYGRKDFKRRLPQLLQEASLHAREEVGTRE